ncbi:hypothetical protein A2U01_0011841 [Trifolium medium]|uniref:Uncharacterized protein n=1 Tax=Trifolium medium TaxID=97028 RepID=A0A392MW41_9FABA|nr:hypothetical protein [Trifolium medium]
MPRPDNVQKGLASGYAVLVVVSFVAIRSSMVIFAILAFVVLKKITV